MTDTENQSSGRTTFSALGQNLECEYGLMEAVGFVLLWLVLTIVTLGIGSFFAIYYFYKSVINKTYVVDDTGRRIGKLNCELNLAEMIGHMLIWILLTIVTLGIGLIFYAFRTLRLCLNKTTIARL